MIYKLIFILFFSFPVYAKQDCNHDITILKCVDFIKNFDADTITVNIPHLHPLLASKVNIMLAGVKAPSVNARNKCAKKVAREGKSFVYSLLKNAKYIEITEAKRAKKFAIEGKVLVDGKDLTKILLKKQYVVNKKEFKKKDWCK